MEKITFKDLLNFNFEQLKNKIIVFPTDTVYGVACLASDEAATKRIYELKLRDFDKPLALLVASLDDAKRLISLNDESISLLEKFWPGALTFISEKKCTFNNIYLDRFSTLGLRMPNETRLLEVLAKFGPFATTSINISGNKPLNSIDEIEAEFASSIDYLIIDEAKLSEVSSTVVMLSGNNLNVLRQGEISIK